MNRVCISEDGLRVAQLVGFGIALYERTSKAEPTGLHIGLSNNLTEIQNWLDSGVRPQKLIKIH